MGVTATWAHTQTSLGPDQGSMAGQTPNPSSGRLQEHDTAHQQILLIIQMFHSQPTVLLEGQYQLRGEELPLNISSLGSAGCLTTLTSSLGFSNMEELLQMGASQLSQTSVFIRRDVKETPKMGMNRRCLSLMSHGFSQIPLWRRCEKGQLL